ncbi:unnamed protein product, partial [Ectocarpus sp. 13 AM-2016]
MPQLSLPPTGIDVLTRFGLAGKHVEVHSNQRNCCDPAGRYRVNPNRTAGEGTHSGVLGLNLFSASQSQRARGMVGRVTKAHMASTCRDLSERQLLGEDR